MQVSFTIAGRAEDGRSVLAGYVLEEGARHEVEALGEKITLSVESLPSAELARAIVWVAKVNGEIVASRPHRVGNLSVTASPVIPTPEKRSPHPDGRTCEECDIFDRTRGRRMFLDKTHHYQNGKLSLIQEVTQHLADQHGLKGIDPLRIGWCAPHFLLTDGRAPACTEKFVLKKEDRPQEVQQ